MPEAWTIKGDYVEACNCEVACQCVWLEPPDDDVCTVSLVWDIKDGQYGDVDLSGRKVAMLAHTDEGVMFAPGTGWYVALVIDDEAGLPGTFPASVTDLGASARQVIDDAADVILAGAGIEAAHSALKARDELADRIDDLDRELYHHDDPAEAYVAGLVLDSIRRTAEYGANVAGVAVQQVSRERV